MLRGLWKLTWLEIKIFLREPLGAIGSIVFPVLVFVGLGRFTGGRPTQAPLAATGFLRVGLPVFVSVLIALNGVLSLVTIISIYRKAAFSSGSGPRPCAHRRFSLLTCWSNYRSLCLPWP